MANRSAKVEVAFGNDNHIFKLGWGQIKEIQDTVDAGPFVILNSLINSTYKIDYVREIIRCGLIGGGKPASEAIRLVKTYVEDLDNYPLQYNASIAFAILGAALVGAQEEDVSKKSEAAGEKAPNSRRSKTEK